MRTSQTSTRARLIRAGLATAAATVVVVAGTAAPAFAADVVVTVSPTTGPVGGGNTVTVAGTGVFTGITTPGGKLIAQTATQCPATFTATSVTAPNVVITKTSDNGGTFVGPATLANGAFRVCLYNGTTTTSVIAGHTADGSGYTIGPVALTLTPTTGGVGGGNITAAASLNYTTPATALSALVTTAVSCPATYNTASPAVAATAVKTTGGTANQNTTVTIPSGLNSGSTYKVCVYNGTSNALIGSATSYQVLPTLSLSPTVGPTGGTNTITASASTGVFAGSPNPGVIVAKDPAVCPATYVPGTNLIAATGVQKISNTKILFTVPSSTTLDVSAATTPYTICVYASTSAGAMITTTAAYTVAPVLSVSSITPAGGPAQGGSEVTVAGTGFPTDPDAVVTVSVGGSPLTGVQVVSSTSLTGVTTAHAAGNATVSVTTAAGTKSAVSPFVYSYGITISPKTAPTNTQTYVDILGVGFSALTFGTGNPTTAGGSRVFLVKDAYDGTEDGTTGHWDNQPVQECTGIFPISDNEIICELDLANTLNDDGTANTADVANGTYQIAVVKDAEPGAVIASGDVSIISSGSTFTVAPY